MPLLKIWLEKDLVTNIEPPPPPVQGITRQGGGGGGAQASPLPGSTHVSILHLFPFVEAIAIR